MRNFSWTVASGRFAAVCGLGLVLGAGCSGGGKPGPGSGGHAGRAEHGGAGGGAGRGMAGGGRGELSGSGGADATNAGESGQNGSGRGGRGTRPTGGAGGAAGRRASAGGTNAASGGSKDHLGGAGDGGESEGGASGDTGQAGGGAGGVGGASPSGGRSSGGAGAGGNGATRSCCHGGTQTLSGGVWGACQGAFVSSESCNGEDDDCNGEDDDIGTVSCGIGACKTTVNACAGGDVNHCIPGTPSTAPDGCDGVDNDCDGAVDEDCAACLHVALDGDDGAAVAAQGATAFRNVQPALDFAAAHPAIASRVCVAPGSTCGSVATFPGPTGADLTMHDGIELLGGYESTGWTRCTTSTTTLAPQTGAGVAFPASITHQTVLDGFAIARSAAAASAGVTVQGRGALLSNLSIKGGPTVVSSYGVNVIGGGDATIVRSSIDAALATQEMIAVRASGGTVAVEDACATAPDATTGRCTATCGTPGAGISVSYVPSDASSSLRELHAVLLENAPGSRIERSTICASVASRTTTGLGPDADVAGVAVRGDATGVALRANTIQADISGLSGAPVERAVSLVDCGGAAPRITDNEHVELTPSVIADLGARGIYAAGDCHPVIDSNTSVGIPRGTWVASNETLAMAVDCESNANVPSRCVVARSGVAVQLTFPSLPGSFDNLGGTGVECGGGSCARVEGNVIQGAGSYLSSPSSSHNLIGTGIDMEPAYDSASGTTTGQRLWVAGNEITGTYASGTCGIHATGIYDASGTGRFENNVIIGAKGAASCSPAMSFPSATGYFGLAGPADVNSNYIASTWSTDSCISGAAASGSSGNTFRNNILVGCGTAFQGTPAAFEHNVLSPMVYTDGSGGDIRNAADVDALTDTYADGTIAGTCALSTDYHLAPGSLCIDAGTPAGAPPFDRDGDARDASPDIGPDEYVP